MVAEAMKVHDPRVDALTSWAREDGTPLSAKASRALAALRDSPPRPEAAAAVASAVSAAYARVPTRGPRDLGAGHRMVEVLAALGEAGARELVELRDNVMYQLPRRRVARALAQLERELKTPLGELEDRFAGVDLDAELRCRVAVGPFEAILAVTADLQRVQTSWREASGRVLSRRPSSVASYPNELADVEDCRRRLRAHLKSLRSRFERAMTGGRSWAVDDWSDRMFADPLRAAMARRLIWHLEGKPSILVLPEQRGLRDVKGSPVSATSGQHVALWHPADDRDSQPAWRERLCALHIEQPIAQAARDVVPAYQDAPNLNKLTGGHRVRQTPLRGFLRGRGWELPYIGPWFNVPEATREMTRQGPVAVLELTLDPAAGEDADTLILGDFRFRSILGKDLDARTLPAAVVSEAARDVLGAISQASADHIASDGKG